MKTLTRLAALALLAACGGPGQAAPKPDAAAPAGAPASSGFVYETVAEGLDVPWSLAFLPDGAMLVTERDGRLRVIRDGVLDPTPVTGVPEVFAQNQGGLFEAVPHPDFARNRTLYLTYSAGTRQANATRLARATFDGKSLDDVEVLFEAVPQKAGGAHFGGRTLWLPDGTLLLTLGDGFAYREQAQAKDGLFGKIVRLRDDGGVPQDNPFVGQSGVRPEIYTLGHRNVQGIARDPETGAIYAHEHGPRGGDELNLLKPGLNYGWPVITYGVDYSGAQISPFTERPGLEQPLVQWTPSIAPSGMTFYTGAAFPAWRGDVLVSALAGSKVQRVDLEGGKVVGQETLFADLEARIRDVRQGPDGFVYLLDESNGKVIRVRPKT